MKFIHLTDTHLIAPGRLLHGLDPAARLTTCVDRILERDADAAFCVLTGDVADAGESEAYRTMREQIARLPMPVYLIPGNHDHRERLREVFPDLPASDDGFVQYRIEHDGVVCLMLDTLEPTRGAGGALCESRAGWLARELEAAGDAPVLLFMHHPPFAVGVPGLDEIGLGDPGPMIEALSRGGNVQHLFFGHVHRPISGQWRGIAFSTLYGTSHQVALTLGDTEWLGYTDEPPAYAVVLVEPDRVLVHTHQFTVPIRELGGHPTLAALS